METHEIRLSGRIYEDAETLRKRIGLKSDTGLRKLQQQGMPAPIFVGKRRFFDRFQVDAWLVKRVK